MKEEQYWLIHRLLAATFHIRFKHRQLLWELEDRPLDSKLTVPERDELKAIRRIYAKALREEEAEQLRRWVAGEPKLVKGQ